MMRVLPLLLLFFTTSAFSQMFYTPCKDSNKVENIFYYCYDDYQPVCGCDGNTYRNECSAENQYALSDDNWIAGPCTEFDYDLSPNQVIDYLKFKFWKKKPGYFVVNIFDAYGHHFYTRAYSYNQLDAYLQIEISLFGFRHGLYIIEVISEGEQQIKKFFKVNY